MILLVPIFLGCHETMQILLLPYVDSWLEHK